MYYVLCTVYSVLNLSLGELPSYRLDPLVVGELHRCIMYIVYVVYNVLCTVYNVQCTTPGTWWASQLSPWPSCYRRVRCIMYTVYLVYNVLCTVYSVVNLGLGELPSYRLDPLVVGELHRCIMYIVYVVYNVLCTVYNVQCTTPGTWWASQLSPWPSCYRRVRCIMYTVYLVYNVLCTVYSVLHLGLSELSRYLLDPLVVWEVGGLLFASRVNLLT